MLDRITRTEKSKLTLMYETWGVSALMPETRMRILRDVEATDACQYFMQLQVSFPQKRDKKSRCFLGKDFI